MSAILAPNLSLEDFLDAAGRKDDKLAAVGAVVSSIASAALELAHIISRGPLGEGVEVSVGTLNTDGDMQKKIDVLAHDKFVERLRTAPVAAILSEELREPLTLDTTAPLVVAIDPLDGSSNIDTATSVGTIFSILPALPGANDPEEHFLRPGHTQIAAGFVIYGPQTSLVLTLGCGTHIFTFDREVGGFRSAKANTSIPKDSREYAINASNYRHWIEPVRAYVDDCVTGIDGPFARDHNMRWIASLVAEAFRILACGGVFLYPADYRPDYSCGRLRLLHEANPISFLIEQAGGSATDSVLRILDRYPTGLHVRTPFVFGSSDPVQRIISYHIDPQSSSERSPLFGRRGLMRL